MRFLLHLWNFLKPIAAPVVKDACGAGQVAMKEFPASRCLVSIVPEKPGVSITLTTKKGTSIMGFNFAQIAKLFALAPVVIAGIEQLHGEADSVTKAQLAADSLTLATGVADAVAPGEQAITDSVSSGVRAVIDSTVKIFNATGVFSHKTAVKTS